MAIGRVLVVDDEPEVGAAIRDLLIETAYVVKIALRGAEALRLADVFQPDVVLLDLNMPEMSGLEVLARLRQRHPQLPVIVVTANDDLDIAKKTLAQGAFDYVMKPFTLELVERVVGAALGRPGP